MRLVLKTAVSVDDKKGRLCIQHHVKVTVNVKDDLVSWWVTGVFCTMCVVSHKIAPKTYWSERTLNKAIFGQRLMEETIRG